MTSERTTAGSARVLRAADNLRPGGHLAVRSWVRLR